jgi:hypothetical protein
MSIDTAIENMIESYIDDQDFVSRTDASMEAESYTDQCIGDIQDELGVLMVRLEALSLCLEALEVKINPAAEEQDENLLQELADSAPRAVNQIDWILGGRAGSTSIFAGYPTIEMLEQFVRSNLGTEEESKTMMIIMMTLATARNLINEKLEAES